MMIYNYLGLSVPDEACSKYAFWTLDFIPMFVLQLCKGKSIVNNFDTFEIEIKSQIEN
jgi:hypothetical protein